MSGVLDLTIAGESVRLLATRALYWPRERALLIADLHLGKADIFRGAGIALPSGGTHFDLERISAALQATGARTLMVLGDMIHGPTRRLHWRAEWDRWRSRHSSTRIVAIGGNHDRGLARLSLGIDMVGDGLSVGPFQLRHAPTVVPGRATHLICGHLHPVVRLPRISGRWPAFALGEKCTVLPAFSAFTGGQEVRESPVAACVKDTITLIRGPEPI